VTSVVCVGEITVDHYLDQGRELVGGISLNFAVNARQLGAARVGLVSATGDDAGAALVRAKLARAQVEDAHVRTLAGMTARQKILLLPGGERVFPPGGYHPGVLADLRLSDADLDYIRGFDVVAVPVFRQIEHLVRPVLEDRSFAGRRAADFLDGADLGDGLRELQRYLPQLDLAFLSGGEDTLAAVAPLARSSRGVIVVTLGAQGSVALAGEERLYQPALPARETLDTTGAGDAFQAAFTLSYCANGDLRRALHAGATRAAQVIGHYGATDG